MTTADSVLLSTEMYRDLIGQNTLKIVSRLINLGCKLSAQPNITDDHREIPRETEDR